jgi:hypothetical protein
MPSFFKDPPPVRSEAYRRLVARLPCVNCGVDGASQCAHTNSSKAKGRKQCDLDCFPLCHEGATGCHADFDQYRICPANEMLELEATWKRWTVAALIQLAGEERKVRATLVKLGVM